MSIHIHEGSILDVKADAIVNPANNFLNHSGGLARVINLCALGLTSDGRVSEKLLIMSTTNEGFNEATRLQTQWADEQRNAPLIATGNVHVTSAGHLPYKAVIHAVGPIWNGGGFCERDLLEIVMETVLDTCDMYGFRSVAVPAISCGIFGFPVAEAARILVSVAKWYEDLDITFALTDREHVKEFCRQLA